jgi:hypothetical protein
MFWNQTENSIPTQAAQARLRDDLRERLRLVADFATLGAYTEDDTAPERHEDGPRPRAGETTRRLFLFTRAPVTRCAHSPEPADSCPTTTASRIPRPARSSLRRRVPRRRGGVAASTQPCLCAPADPSPVPGRPAR